MEDRPADPAPDAAFALRRHLPGGDRGLEEPELRLVTPAGKRKTAVVSDAPTSAESIAPRRRRLDIQGLRAIAVLSVVAYHAGLSVPGGFVGVDVFFVISGFVITSMLRREWDATGRIRFGHFYARRFKRLTPALAVMVAVTVFIGAFVLSPLGPQHTAVKTAVGAMLIAANYVIAGTTGAYFDAPAETNPLLNTWTLSVEEQFYVVFPALLAIGWALTRRNRRLRYSPLVLVGGVATLSLLAMMLKAAGLTGTHAAFLVGFYGPVARAWEFALGALLALAVRHRSVSQRLAAVSGIAGVVLIAVALWSINGKTTFPGPWTLVPVFGSALVLLAGLDANPVSRLLARRPLVKIGDWSYSIYLWHWPLIVFAALLWPETPHVRLAAAAVSLVPAVASYYWIEEPIRNWSGLSRARFASLVATVFAVPIALALGMPALAHEPVVRRFTTNRLVVAHPGGIDYIEFFRFIRSHYYPCTPKAIRDHAVVVAGIRRCAQSKPGSHVDVALVGDSHAEHLFVGFADALRNHNVAYYIQGELPVRREKDTRRIIDFVAASKTIKTVLVEVWWLYPPYQRGHRVPVDEVAATLRIFRDAGKAVFVTDGLPDFPFDAYSCKYRRPLGLKPLCTRDARSFWKAYSTYAPKLEAVVRRLRGVHLLHTARYFCNAKECAMTRGRRLLYRDRTHLNVDGSRYLVSRMLKDNQALAGAVGFRTPFRR